MSGDIKRLYSHFTQQSTFLLALYLYQRTRVSHIYEYFRVLGMDRSVNRDNITAKTLLDLATSPACNPIATNTRNTMSDMDGGDGVDIDEYLSSSIKFSDEI